MLPSILCETTEHSTSVLFCMMATSYLCLLTAWHGASLTQFTSMYHFNSWIRRFWIFWDTELISCSFPVNLLRKGSRFLIGGLSAVGFPPHQNQQCHGRDPVPAGWWTVWSTERNAWFLETMVEGLAGTRKSLQFLESQFPPQNNMMLIVLPSAFGKVPTHSQRNAYFHEKVAATCGLFYGQKCI